MLNPYVVICAGSFSRHAVDMHDIYEYHIWSLCVVRTFSCREKTAFCTFFCLGFVLFCFFNFNPLLRKNSVNFCRKSWLTFFGLLLLLLLLLLPPLLPLMLPDVTVVVAAAGAGAGAVTNRRLSSQTWQKLIFCWKKNGWRGTRNETNQRSSSSFFSSIFYLAKNSTILLR